jgi:hypothetical protein
MRDIGWQEPRMTKAGTTDFTDKEEKMTGQFDLI